MKPLKLFISYAHKDEGYRERLGVHLAALQAEGYYEVWHDRDAAGRPGLGQGNRHPPRRRRRRAAPRQRRPDQLALRVGPRAGGDPAPGGGGQDPHRLGDPQALPLATAVFPARLAPGPAAEAGSRRIDQRTPRRRGKSPRRGDGGARKAARRHRHGARQVARRAGHRTGPPARQAAAGGHPSPVRRPPPLAGCGRSRRIRFLSLSPSSPTGS